MARALKVCSTSGCPTLVTSGRCSQCDAKADRKRPTATKRGYDARWRRTRAAHLLRSPLCVEPGCGSPATDVDHVDNLGPLGPRGHDHTNLQSLCHSHHSRKTASETPGGWAQR